MQPEPANLRYLNEEVQRLRATADQAFDGGASADYHQPMPDLTRQQVTDLLAASEAKAGERQANFQLDIKSGFADLRAEFAQVRTEMANDRAATSKQSNESQRWIVTAVFAMISIAVALIGAMINYNKGDKPSATPPAPIVIYAQPAASAAPPAAAAPTAQTKQ